MELINLLIPILTFAIFALASLLYYAEALAKVDEKFIKRKLRWVVLSLFAIFTVIIFLGIYPVFSSPYNYLFTTPVAFITLMYFLGVGALFLRYFSLKKEYGYIRKESIKPFLIFFILATLGVFIFIFVGVYGIYKVLQSNEALSFISIVEILLSIFVLLAGIAVYVILVLGFNTGYAKKEKGKEIKNENKI